MLTELRDRLVYGMSGISFKIQKRTTSTTIENNDFKEYKSYIGCLSCFDNCMNDVVVGLNGLDKTGEYNESMGYLDILNGHDSDKDIPLIRVFIKRDLQFFCSIDKELMERKLFNLGGLVTLTCRFNISNLVDNSPERKVIDPHELLNIKLPVNSIEMYQDISFV